MEDNANVFYSLMENAKDLEKINKTAQDSVGSAQKEQEKYSNSLEAKISAMKERIKGMFIDLGNTDVLKGVIGGLDTAVSGARKLADTFGILPATIGIAVGVLTAFNQKFREVMIDKNIFGIGKIDKGFNNKIDNSAKQYSKSLDELISRQNKLKDSVEIFGGSATRMKMKLNGLKIGMIALKIATEAAKVATIAFESAMTAGISLLISFGIEAAVKGFSKLQKSIYMTNSQLKEFNQNYLQTAKKSTDEIADAEKSLDKINSLKNKISETKDGKERVKLQEELIGLQRSLAETLPDTVSGFDKEGKAIASNNNLIREQIKLKKQEKLAEATDFAKENKRNLKDFKEYFKLRKQYDDVMSGKTVRTSGNSRFRSPQKDLKKVNEEMTETLQNITAIKQAINDMKLAGLSDQEITAKFGGKDVIAMAKEFDENLNKIDQDSKPAKEGVDEVTASTEDLAKASQEAAKELKNLSDAFSSLCGEVETVDNAIKEFQKNGQLSADTVQKIFSTNDPRLISLLADSNNFVEKATQLEKNLQEERTITYNQTIAQAQDMVANGVDCENQIVGATAQASNEKLNIKANETAQKAGLYNNDVNNHGNAENTKSSQTANTSNSITGTTSSMVSTLGQQYTSDVNNYSNSLNSKLSATEQFVNQNNSMLANSMNQVKSISSMVRDMTNTNLANFKTPDFKFGDEKYKDSILYNPNKFSSNIKPINPVHVGFNPVKVNYSPRSSSGHGGSRGGRGSGKGSRGNSEKVDIKDIEEKVDRYRALQDALDDVGNSLQRNESLQEHGSYNKRKEYLKNEIKLLNQKTNAINNMINAQRQEKSELEWKLRNKGLRAYNGDIDNYVGKLNEIKNRVNSMSNSNKSKEQAIKNYKDLQQSANRYLELSNKISSSENDLLGIDQQIADTKKKILEDPFEDIKVDRYKVLQDTLDDINNSLEKNKTLQDQSSLREQKEYLEEEINLLKQKRNAINDITQVKLQESMELESELRNNGFNAINGNIDNYVNQVEKLKADLYSDSDPELAKKKFDKLIESADRYFALTSNELPGLKRNWLEVNKEITEVNNKKLEDPLEDVKIDKYKALQDVLNNLNNSIEASKSYQTLYGGERSLEFIHQEIDLLRKKKNAIDNLTKAKREEAKELEARLRNNGFNAHNGNIDNYVSQMELMKARLYNSSNPEKARKEFDKLVESTERYFEITSNELPGLLSDWRNTSQQIKDSRKEYINMMASTEREVTNIIKNELDKRKKSMEDETNKIKEEIQKQKDAYNKQYDDEDYKSELAGKRDELNKIEQQIEEAGRNNTLQGEQILKDLMEQKKKLQEDMNKVIRDKQKHDGNEMFDKESDKLEKELKERQESLDKKYSPEHIAELTKGLIQKGFIEIEGKVVELRGAISDYYKEQGDLFADSSMKMQSFIDNLELTKKLYSELYSMNKDMGIQDWNKVDVFGRTKVNLPIIPAFTALAANIPMASKIGNITLNSNLNVDTVNNGNTEDLQELFDENNKQVIRQIKDSLYDH